MAKRHYTGRSSVKNCSGSYGKCQGSYQGHSSGKLYKDACRLANHTCSYIKTACTALEGNYLAICTLIAILVLSFLLPDFSAKMQVNKDMKEMQKVLNMMAKEVNRAEAACITAAEEICCLQCSVRDDSTETSNDVRDLSVCTSNSLRTTHSEPVQVEKQLGFLRRLFLFPNRNASRREIAIMSFVYTNSFDAKKPTNAATVTEID